MWTKRGEDEDGVFYFDTKYSNRSFCSTCLIIDVET